VRPVTSELVENPIIKVMPDLIGSFAVKPGSVSHDDQVVALRLFLLPLEGRINIRSQASSLLNEPRYTTKPQGASASVSWRAMFWGIA
jgi:hypothetical protein